MVNPIKTHSRGFLCPWQDEGSTVKSVWMGCKLGRVRNLGREGSEEVPRCVGAVRCVSSSSVLHLIKYERTASDISEKRRFSTLSARVIQFEWRGRIASVPRTGTLQPFLLSEIEVKLDTHVSPPTCFFSYKIH